MPISITPNQGPTGGGTVVTISGAPAGATLVKFNTIIVPFTQDPVTHVITVTSPAGGGVAYITVTGPGGVSNPVRFFYVGSPYLASLDPIIGPETGGDVLTIRGIGLATVNTTTGVKMDGTNATAITVVNDGLINATTPPGTGSVAVTVTTAGGFTDGLVYTYQVAPTLTAISPNDGPALGGTEVTITGTNLGSATSVTIGGAVVTTFAVIGPTTLVAITPPGTATGTPVDVVVTTLGGSATLPAAFLYV